MATRNVEYIIQLKDKFSTGIDRLNKKAFQLNNRMKQVNKSTLSLRSAFLALGGAFVVRNIIEATAQMEGLNLAISFASGSASEATKTLKFLDDIAQRLGLDVVATRKGFQTLAGSFLGTGVEASAQRDIFEKVSVAVSALNLSASDSEGVFLALGQIMSKGRVTSEELRRQLGNRLPGAIAIAARAMNKSLPEFEDLMRKGLIPAKEFLPKFAAELEKTFIGALPKSTKSLRANLNRLNAVFLKLKIAAGDELKPAIKALADIVPIMTANIGLLIKTAKTAIGAFVAFKVATFLLIKANALYVIGVSLATIRTRFLTGGLKAATKSARLLGITFKTTGIGLLAGLLATATAAFLFFKDNASEANKELTKFGNKIDEIDAKIGRKLFQRLARGLIDPITNLFKPTGLETLIKALPNLAKSELESLRLFLNEQEELLNRSIINAETALEKTIFEKELNKILQGLQIVNKEFAKFTKGGAIGGVGGITTQQIGITKITSAAPKIFNINIEKLVETINNNVTNLKEGMNESKNIITESLLTVLSDVQIQSR